MVFSPARKKWLPYWLKMPNMVVASDAMPGLGKNGQLLPANAEPEEYAGHPRTAGTYAETLKLAREHEVPLMFTLAQTSYWSAKHLGDAGIEAMAERGRVQVGKIADLTLFDPLKVASRATYKAGEQGRPPVGIPYVIVNGKIAFRHGKVLAIKAGQPIRYATAAKGRFRPVDVNQWLDGHAIKTPGVSSFDDSGATQVIEKE